jgi:hypothetical protein
MDKVKKAREREEMEKFKKPAWKISIGTTKKILDAPASDSDRVWLCNYIQNKIAGDCLPPSLYSNECYNVIIRLYGEKCGETFLEGLRADWRQQNGLVG